MRVNKSYLELPLRYRKQLFYYFLGEGFPMKRLIDPDFFITIEETIDDIYFCGIFYRNIGTIRIDNAEFDIAMAENPPTISEASIRTANGNYKIIPPPK